ncbi:MAG: hypothetical protein ACI9U2_004136, partial [Bradymonadia bacterium]
EDRHCPGQQRCSAQRTCIECDGDAECPGGVCIGNECTECRVNADCDGDAARPLCDPASNRCVDRIDVCQRDADCGQGRGCDEPNNRCYNLDGTCVDDAGCRPEHACNFFLEACTGCGEEGRDPFTVCPGDLFCFVDVCVVP